MNTKLVKYHGLGNDYLVLDPNINSLHLSDKIIRLICDRNFGVGSDGILYGPIFDDGKIKVKIFNPDGSEAEKSGNGIRIFARYLSDAGYIKNNMVTINTLGGDVDVEYMNNLGDMIKAAMGNVSFLSKNIPVSGPLREVIDEMMTFNNHQYKVTCLSIGNPHCVILMNDISKDLAYQLGPCVENHPNFPKRINMQLLKVLDRNNIQIEIYERGAGYTLASGSSSCAAASVAYKLGLVDQNVTVHMPGGQLHINISDNNVYMTGPVSSIGEIELSNQFMNEIENTSYIKRYNNHK